MGMGVKRHVAAALPPGMTRDPLYRWDGRYGMVGKISPPPDFDHWNIQPVASRCTDCAIPTHTVGLIVENKKFRATVFL